MGFGKFNLNFSIFDFEYEENQERVDLNKIGNVSDYEEDMTESESESELEYCSEKENNNENYEEDDYLAECICGFRMSKMEITKRAYETCGDKIYDDEICYTLKLIEEWEINNNRDKCLFADLLGLIFPQPLEDKYYVLTESLRKMALKFDNGVANYLKILNEQKFRACNMEVFKNTVFLIQELIINDCVLKVSVKNCFCRQTLEIVRNVRMKNFNDIPIKGQKKITNYFAIA